MPPPNRLPPVLAPRGPEDGGGPAGVVESPAKRLFGAGVVDPAAEVAGVFAGVPKLNVGVDEVLASGLEAPKEKVLPPEAFCAPKRLPPPDALLFDAPPNRLGPVPEPPALLPNRLPVGFFDASADAKRPPLAAPEEA